MPAFPTLSRAERRTFNEAIEAIEAAKRAWENDDEPLVIDLNEMVAAKRAIGQMLARHTDTAYTLHEDHYRRIILQRYEIIATDLLTAISTLVHGHEYQQESIRNGERYTMTRKIVIAGRTYQYLVGCTNPAVGTLELDKWEAELRQALAFMVAA